MDMGIVNAGQLVIYAEIDPQLCEMVEDVLWNRRSDATDRLVEYAQHVKGQAKTSSTADGTWRNGTVEERLEYALLKGMVKHIEEDAEEARHAGERVGRGGAGTRWVTGAVVLGRGGPWGVFATKFEAH